MNKRKFLLGLGAVAATFQAKRIYAQSSTEISVKPFLAEFGETGFAIQEAINVAIRSGIKTVRVPALAQDRTYAVRRDIINPGVRVAGEGSASVLRRIGSGNCFSSGKRPVSIVSLIQRDIQAGIDWIDVKSFVQMIPEPGTTYILTSESHCHANTPAHCGEFITVKSVTKGVVELTAPIEYNYLVSEKAAIRVASQNSNVGYCDLSIEMDPTVTPPGAMTRFDNYGIILDFCQAPFVENISISNGVAAGIRLLGCVDARIDAYRAQNLGSADDDESGSSKVGLGGYGYGIAERGLNSGLKITDAKTDKVRHLYTSAAEWFDTFRYGMPTGSVIANCTSKNARGASFDTHETGSRISFINCHAEGGEAVGFQLRSKDALLSSCTARNINGAAVWIYGSNVHPNAAGNNCRVRNLIAKNVNIGRPSNLNSNIQWAEQGSIIDQGYGSKLDNVIVGHCSGPILTIASTARNGIYRNIHGSNICERAITNNVAVKIEKSLCTDQPDIEGLCITQSPNTKSLIRYNDFACKTEVKVDCL